MIKISRRTLVLTTIAMSVSAGLGLAQEGDEWSVDQVHAALLKDEVVLIDVRRPEEWAQTGVAEGAWPLDMTSKDFVDNLMQARDLAEGRPVALICRTANRTGFLMRQIRQAGLTGFVDTKGGMAGKAPYKGWIDSDLPRVSAEDAIANLPDALK